MNIKQVFKENKEGFSINFNGLFLQNPSSGFMVSITNNYITYEDDLESTFKNVCLCLIQLNYCKDNLFIGGWKDTDNIFYLDATLWVENLETAFHLGRIFKQDSVYNCKEKRAIKV